MSKVKVKTATLEGAALDWAVGKILGHEVVIETIEEQAKVFRQHVHSDGSKPQQEAVAAVISNLRPILRIKGEFASHLERLPKYSTDWAKAGPIIDENKFDVLYMGNGVDEHYSRFPFNFAFAAIACRATDGSEWLNHIRPRPY